MGYIVIVRKSAESAYGAEVPDLPGCISVGEDLDELRGMIAEAMRLHLDGILDDGGKAPRARSLSQIEATLTPELRGNDFLALLEVEPLRESPRALRVNVSFDEGLLRSIDEHAKREGLTRSGFLAEAASAVLRRRQAS
jgi:predicted RNase H-like HicB family nuclease